MSHTRRTLVNVTKAAIRSTRCYTFAPVFTNVSHKQVPTTPLFRQFHVNTPTLKNMPFLLADIGEGIKEVEIIQWHVKEGDTIKQFDKVAEVQSDKANVEISSRYDGVVTKLYMKQGEMAHVGQPLIDIEMSGGGEETPVEKKVEKVTPPVQPVRSKNAHEESLEQVLTTPSVRRIAKEHQIDLRTVTPTGPRGRLLKEDLLNYIKNGQEPIVVEKPSEPIHVEQQDRVEPVRGLKRTMIKTMNASNSVPQFGLHDEINVDRLIMVRNDFKLLAAKKGIEKLTFMPFFIKALSLALNEYPILNASISQDETQIIYKASHNIGIAMDTPNGLLVPNIKNVQNKSILEIAKELSRLQQLGTQGKLGAEDLKGGTITLSNIGTIGGTYARPLLTPPEVCIGALGKMRKIPVFHGDKVVPAHVMYVSWSGDHRIVDGATMARFSNAWKDYLEIPEGMMLAMK